jgi:phosphotransferase system HPr-like phosphotransfer protein
MQFPRYFYPVLSCKIGRKTRIEVYCEPPKSDCGRRKNCRTRDRRRCLSQCVIRFKSIITIWKGEENFSAASLLQVLTANLDCGARVILEAIGPDEQEAINELEALLLRFRDEEGWGSGKLKVTAAAEERQLSQNTLTTYRVLGSN